MTDYTLAVAETTGTRARALGPAVIAFFVGVFLLYGVGFAQIPAVHNAAHDTRHSLAFPCH